MTLKIAENIKTLRKQHAFTQEQLAEALGVTVGAVYKWEAGLSVPEVKLIMEMADLFEVSIDALLGYKQNNENVEKRILRIRQCMLEKDFENGVSEVEKALTKYPNHFDVVYASAMMYMVKFSEDKNESSMTRSNELFRNAISLLYQNKHSSINETTIKNFIAENYLMAQQTELGLEILKENNICNINSSLIGYIYAVNLKQPKEAKKYLLLAYSDLLTNMIRTMAGMACMYAEEKDETGLEVALWLNDFFDSIKKDEHEITFTDKLKAVLWAWCSVREAETEHHDNAKEYVKKAFHIARQFDSTPVYSPKGIRFIKDEDAVGVMYDGIGNTAMEAIENFVFDNDELSEAQRYVKNLLEEMKHE